MNFRKSSEGGGGVISNPKIYVADFCHYNRYFGHEFWKKNPQHDFTKMRGGGQRPFGTFWKIHPFLKGQASLSEASPTILLLSLAKLSPYSKSANWSQNLHLLRRQIWVDFSSLNYQGYFYLMKNMRYDNELPMLRPFYNPMLHPSSPLMT